MSLHYIGPHRFTVCQGVVPKISEVIEVIERPGVDGFLRRLAGRQSPEFRLMTFRDFTTRQRCERAAWEYVQLKEDIAQRLIKDDVDYTAGKNVINDEVIDIGETIYVAVLDVRTSILAKATKIAGGIEDGSWELRADWFLRAVPSGEVVNI